MDDPPPIDRRPNYLQPAPPTHASPADLRLSPDQLVRWYLPDWTERLRLLRWRNLLFVPAALLILGLFMSPWWPSILLNLLFGWWKLWVIVVALPLGAAAQAARHALRLRKDPFCIHCGYSVVGLPDGHTCPECGQPFNLKMIEEYRRDPHWFIERYKRRGDLPPIEARFDAGPVRRASHDGT